MLNKLKQMLGITDNSKDELLRILLDFTTSEVVNYTHNNRLDVLENVIVYLSVWKYNRMGTEGVDAENYSGVSFNYTAEYPDDIKKQLQAYRKVQVIR